MTTLFIKEHVSVCVCVHALLCVCVCVICNICSFKMSCPKRSVFDYGNAPCSHAAFITGEFLFLLVIVLALPKTNTCSLDFNSQHLIKSCCFFLV